MTKKEFNRKKNGVRWYEAILFIILLAFALAGESIIEWLLQILNVK